MAWWIERTTVPSMNADDVHFVQPVGFVWFRKPRYRVKAIMRKMEVAA